MATERRTVDVECRGSAQGPLLRAVIVTEGRAASGGRAEVFTPNSVLWPPEGISIRAVHLGPELAKTVPMRETSGEIQIETRATPDIYAAVRAGKKYASVEFRAIDERTTAGGVRELLQAVVVGAALVDTPEYDSTRAEIRTRRTRPVDWWRR